MELLLVLVFGATVALVLGGTSFAPNRTVKRRLAKLADGSPATIAALDRPEGAGDQPNWLVKLLAPFAAKSVSGESAFARPQAPDGGGLPPRLRGGPLHGEPPGAALLLPFLLLAKKKAHSNRVGLQNPGSVLLSHKLAPAVPSALESLTSVFGLGTGATSPVLPPGKN